MNTALTNKSGKPGFFVSLPNGLTNGLPAGLLAALLLLGACAPSGSGTGTGPVTSRPPAGHDAGAPPASGQPGPGATRQAARPPQLPSLEELLGRLLKPDTPELKAPPPLPASGATRVGLLLPLSGPNSRIGHAMLNSAEMALFDFAADDFEVLVRDTKGTPEGAREAARLVIGDGARAIIGPLLSTSIDAIRDQSRAAGVPVIGFSSNRDVAGGGIFTMGFFPGDEVRRVVLYAMERGKNRFGLLAPNDPYGNTVSAALDDIVQQYGAAVTARQFYDPLAPDFAEPVKSIAQYDLRRSTLNEELARLEGMDDEVSRAARERLEKIETIGEPPFDALLVADGSKRLIALGALLPFYDVDPAKVQIMGTGLWDEPGLGAEPALLGGWFAAPDPAGREDFSERYRRIFTARPHRLSTLSYDAMALAIVLGREKNNPYAAERIAQSGGFIGRDGVFRFRSDGLVERGLAVMKVGKKENGVISPAPDRF